MPRPTTKESLIELSHKNCELLLNFINSFSENEKRTEFPPGTMNRNIRDVMAHLHHWHLMFMEWYRIGMKGEKPDIPAKGYTWKTSPDLNRVIWEKYNSTDLDEVLVMFENSFREVQKITQKHSDEELFEKKRYKWTGSTSLGAYLVSATSSHYDWALKLIKKAKK